VRLTAIMIELRTIIVGAGPGAEEQCRELASRVTTSIPDPIEALRLQEELTAKLSMLTFSTSFRAEFAPIWDELLDLVAQIGWASRLNDKAFLADYGSNHSWLKLTH
jgi:hypothetical protein